MKFLIAGFGSIGRRHFRNLKTLGEKNIFFYRSGKSQFDDQELTGYAVERDLTDALARKPDAVVVANPTALHLEVAIPAARSGCHILLEKPISNSLDRVDEFAAAVKKSGSRVLIGFQFRFHPTLKKAREILKSGELGALISARAHWGEYLPDWHPGENYRHGYSGRADLGGGVVLTLSHPFDYLRWLLGEVVEVSGEVKHSGQLEIDVEDEAEAELRFASGAEAKVHLDYLQRPPAHWLEITCAEGSLHWDALRGMLSVKRGKETQESSPPAGFERNQMFLEQMRHFIRVVKGEQEPLCILGDGRRALEIALAIHCSSAEGGKPVKLN